MVKTFGGVGVRVNVFFMWEGKQFRGPEGGLLWVELCLPSNYVEVLEPNTSTVTYLEIGSLQMH